MNKPLILVVEDDTPVRNLITTTLKAHDYRFLTAANGESAVLEASSHNPEIILLDLGLPDMDGVDVIHKVRSWSNVPIIVISARSEDTDKIEALDAGADDYLTKPFSVEELLARLRVTQRRLAALQVGVRQYRFDFYQWQIKGGLRRRLCLSGRTGASLDPQRVQTSLPALQKRRKSTDPHLHHPADLGKKLGKRCCIPACIYGHSAQEAGERAGFSAIHPNPHWGWVPHDES